MEKIWALKLSGTITKLEITEEKILGTCDFEVNEESGILICRGGINKPEKELLLEKPLQIKQVNAVASSKARLSGNLFQSIMDINMSGEANLIMRTPKILELLNVTTKEKSLFVGERIICKKTKLMVSDNSQISGIHALLNCKATTTKQGFLLVTVGSKCQVEKTRTGVSTCSIQKRNPQDLQPVPKQDVIEIVDDEVKRLEAENRYLDKVEKMKAKDTIEEDSTKQCLICCERSKKFVASCGHTGCFSCLHRIKTENKICPYCRDEITNIIPLYL